MKIFLSSLLLLISMLADAGQRRYLIIDRQVDCYDFSIDTSSLELAIEARAAFDFGRLGPGKSQFKWGISWNHDGEDGSFDYVVLRLVNTDFGNITDKRVAEVEYGHHSIFNDSVIASGILENGHDIKGGENTLAVEWFDGRMRVLAGDKILKPVIDIVSALPFNRKCRVFSTGKLGLKTVTIENIIDMRKQLSTGHTLDELLSWFDKSLDPVEGIWTYLDRVTDDNRARLGGIYNICIVKEKDGYKILYHSGAKVNAERWTPMMTKGELSPTPFVGHYDLKWYDAMMNVVEDECSATIDSEGILSLQFPLHRSSLRFYRNK